MVISNITKFLSLRKDRPTVPLTNRRLKVAFIISRILGPFPLLVILWLATALKSGIGFWRALWVYPLILFITLIIPIGLSTFLVAKGKVSDIEWSLLSDRKKYLLPIISASLLTLCVLTYFLTNATIFHLTLLFSSIVFIMFLFWVFANFKMSGHMVVATLTFSGINLMFDMQYLWIFLLLIPLAWARLTLKVHTVSELIAGFLLPIFLMLLALSIFGWPGI